MRLPCDRCVITIGITIVAITQVTMIVLGITFFTFLQKIFRCNQLRETSCSAEIYEYYL
jgi:hypothetical protein